MFTAQDVAKLREITGAGMMDCKKALTATDGDMEKAGEFLREQGISVVAKKAGRIASEGAVASAVSANGKIGALCELNCESDFVGKSPAFQKLCGDVAAAVVSADPADLDALLSAAAEGGTVAELITAATASIGEKLSLRRFVRQQIALGREESYIHMGGKIGVLLEVETSQCLNANSEFITMCHDIAMHIAAISPKYVYESEVPQSEIDKEKEIIKAQLANDPANKSKPEAILEKMAGGKIKKFIKEVCLVEQEYVKDASLTVGAFVAQNAKKFGCDIKIVRFSKFIMGEGLEKKSDNLAEEVAKMQVK
ncbi:MAG: translation elongation factor Ts [Firmicutes bacterium]|nr:translation elongation factor Ts [Bacillota bacterium]